MTLTHETTMNEIFNVVGPIISRDFFIEMKHKIHNYFERVKAC